MSNVQDIIESPIRLRKSVIEEGLRKIKSHSIKISFLQDFSYCLDFAPKIKPKKSDSIPSPMNLNSKKRKQKSNLSCPERKGDLANKSFFNIDKFSLEEENESTDEDPYFVEESPEEKLFVRSNSKDESELKFFIEKNDFENDNEKIDLNVMSKIYEEEVSFSKQIKNSPSIKKNGFENQLDEYELIKATSFDAREFEPYKMRRNSILRSLEAGCKNSKIDDY